LSGSDILWYGGGIAVVGTSSVNTPQITNNTITGNTAKPPAGSGASTSKSFGGGIYVGYKTKPTVENNTITNNESGDRTLPSGSQTEGDGGGVFVFGNKNNGATVVTRNLVSGNKARDYGGGVSVYSYCLGGGCQHTKATISNNEIRNNSAGLDASHGRGGGVFTNFAIVTLANNTIHSNSAGTGGGHYKHSETAGTDSWVDANNIYTSNTSNNASTGGGIHAFTTCPTIRYEDFWQNSPQQLGGTCSDSIIG